MEIAINSESKKGERKERPKRLTLRLSEKEYAMITEKAKKLNLKLNVFVLCCVDEKPIIEALNSEKYRTVSSIANNLNQLVKFTHLGNKMNEDIHEILQLLKNTLKR